MAPGPNVPDRVLSVFRWRLRHPTSQAFVFVHDRPAYCYGASMYQGGDDDLNERTRQTDDCSQWQAHGLRLEHAGEDRRPTLTWPRQIPPDGELSRKTRRMKLPPRLTPGWRNRRSAQSQTKKSGFLRNRLFQTYVSTRSWPPVSPAKSYLKVSSILLRSRIVAERLRLVTRKFAENSLFVNPLYRF